MKFGKLLKNEIPKFPQSFQKHFINYKKWKTIIKEYKKNMQTKSIEMQIFRTSTIIRLLIIDIELIECTFKSNINIHETCLLILFPILKKKYLVTETFAYEFAKINTEAIRKICKRLDKSINKNTFMPWFIKCKENHKYSFLGGQDMTYLSLKYTNLESEKIKECPICMEDITTLIILECGHYMCNSCITKIKTNKNLSKMCPFCKCNSAFMKTLLIQV